jgi:hypothetical protein
MHTIRAFKEAFPSARIDAVRALGGLPAMPMHAGRAFVLESIKEKRGRPTKYGDTIITARFVTAPNTVAPCSYNNVLYAAARPCSVLAPLAILRRSTTPSFRRAGKKKDTDY